MTIKPLTTKPAATKPAAAALSMALLLLGTVPSMAATAAPADAYRNGVATLDRETHGDHAIGTRRQARIDMDRQMADWLHRRGKDSEALPYLTAAIGQASQAR